jgi:hypothetical protein
MVTALIGVTAHSSSMGEPCKNPGFTERRKNSCTENRL